mgnify:CR=1 FL=1
MIRGVKHTAAVILAVAGTAFAIVAPASASAAPAGAASVSSGSVAGPDFTCPSGALCTFYGENLNNAPHVWWPGNRSGKWNNFHKLHVNNPGSLRNNSKDAVWVEQRGRHGFALCLPGGTGLTLEQMQHQYGWFYITNRVRCRLHPPKA